MSYWNGTRWLAETDPPARQPRRLPRRLLGVSVEAGLITMLIFGLIAGTALGAKGGNGAGKGGGAKTTSTLAGPVMDSDANADGLPNHWDHVTFEVSTTATDRPFVGLRCWQGATWVYDGYVGYFDDYMFDEDWFVLDSPYWEPGLDATCTARLFYYDKRGNQRVLATLDFPVAP